MCMYQHSIIAGVIFALMTKDDKKLQLMKKEIEEHCDCACWQVLRGFCEDVLKG